MFDFVKSLHDWFTPCHVPPKFTSCSLYVRLKPVKRRQLSRMLSSCLQEGLARVCADTNQTLQERWCLFRQHLKRKVAGLLSWDVTSLALLDVASSLLYSTLVVGLRTSSAYTIALHCRTGASWTSSCRCSLFLHSPRQHHPLRGATRPPVLPSLSAHVM